MLTMVFTFAMGGLAISAIYMAGSTSILSKLYDRERDYRYAAEWALAIGKSRLMTDTAFALPDSLYVQILNGSTVVDAGGQAVPRVRVDLYAGVGGNSTGQYGRFVEMVAVAYDNGGAQARAPVAAAGRELRALRHVHGPVVSGLLHHGRDRPWTRALQPELAVLRGGAGTGVHRHGQRRHNGDRGRPVSDRWPSLSVGPSHPISHRGQAVVDAGLRRQRQPEPRRPTGLDRVAGRGWSSSPSTSTMMER